jgi:hypothetical protein
MNVKAGCLYLVLILLAAWADELRAGTFLAASPTGAPVFGQEIYPISRRHVAEIKYSIERQPLDAAYRDTAIEFTPTADFALPILNETTPQVFRSADPCYRFMSLQW